MNKWGKLISILLFLFSLFLFPTSAKAQFQGDFGSISGQVRWGTETLPSNAFIVNIVGNSTGHTNSTYDADFNTGFSLPPDTYTVTARITAGLPYGGSGPGSPLFDIGSQTVTVAEGQAVTGINFDASTVSGLVKGTFKINGVPSSGWVQFCSPVVTDPCPAQRDANNGPSYNFGGNFKLPVAPGSYRVHVTTDATNAFSAGIVPITITAGQILDLTTSTVSVPSGQNVTVSLAGIEVTFSDVTTSGFMSATVTSHPQGGQPPSQYRFLGTYYELTTTVAYTGPITVKFTYNDADVHGQESNLKLFHWDGVQWVDITLPPPDGVDTVNNIITGVTPTLSPFAIGDLLNSPPTADAGGPYQVDEGGSVGVTASGSDPENGTLTYAWDLDNNGSFETTGQSVTFSAAGLDGPITRTVAVQVTDEGGLTATDQATVEVANVAPSVGTVTAPVEPVAITNSVNAGVNFTDPGTSDTHTAVWKWGDSSTSEGTVTGGSATGSHPYTSAGVYTVKVTVTDDDGGSNQQTFQFVVVYDPNGGFVTGGGWIDSPSGAYTTNSTLTGKANFGFVSKYQQGATVPTGNTKFQFKVADLNFDSTIYDWLVVAGPNAKYKGSGTINGEGDYGFILNARDGQVNGGGGVDKFRIKIWDKATDTVVYDNQLGDSGDSEATDTIEAGSIVIHN
ncbi:MAG: hypothetical protein UT08_C0002G0061 [Candidatus Woesebacteria bacterium GW2011_GWB1_38_8]|uniref:PKD domain-containing protein n=1 Tax=Candidatus Woesebacteria bacterium GW2011_GWB1_38_8 TaxID=1618570 RepID=A0A0G0NJE3_9BACT|nr:MAG: hypothetical protein UT08_C0002G0061 [Candidatus Woesebacteria bacterium GW2011_GWB1_38_8]